MFRSSMPISTPGFYRDDVFSGKMLARRKVLPMWKVDKDGNAYIACELGILKKVRGYYV